MIRNVKDALLEKNFVSTDKRIEVGATLDNDHVLLSVRDNGPGIPPDIREHIFDAFFSTKPETGTGLGLGIVKKYATLYGGRPDFESKAGKGTIFTVSPRVAS